MFGKFQQCLGAVSSFFPVMPQLTNRNLAIDTLKVNEAKYRSLFENIDQSVIYLDAASIVMAVNQAAEQLLGIPRDIIIGRKFVDSCVTFFSEDGSVLPEERHPSVLALRTGKPVEDVVIRLFNADRQSYLWVVVNSVPEFRMGESQPHQVLMTLTDITPQKQSEDELSMASVIFNNIGEGIFVTDKDRKIVSINDAFTELTGFTQQDVYGQDAQFLQSKKNSLKMADELNNFTKTVNNWQGEVWRRHKSNADFPSWTTVNEVKDSNGEVLHYVHVFMDITHFKKAQDHLGFLAYHDPLTRLPNRLLLKDRIDHSLQNALREGSQAAVLFLDLDRFKGINDTYGHAVGDGLLREVAKRIKNLVRKEDTVSRYAGDEFVVFMENIPNTKNPAKLARKLIDTFNAPVYIKGYRLKVSTSVGISLFPQDGRDTDTLIKNADAAMYRAKKEGRNNFQYYSLELTTEAFEKMSMECALRQSIERHELVLYYQPQVCLKTGELIGVESSVRWMHPTLGLMPPKQFISIAEESGFIVALGEWALQHACMQMVQWLEEELYVNKMIVNVSAIQFLRSDFVATVERVLTSTGLDPSYLELELTGSGFMDNSGQMIKALNKLVALGIELTIDDFGVGCFSFNNLKRIPVKKLKINSSFVADVLDDVNDEDIIRALVALGHGLHLQVVAIGVESKAQHQRLIDLGCDGGQGYLYSSPVLPRSNIFRNLIGEG
ncbi:putative bifunctional diguanylate cyclase/phosphodiesterase [Candidatus Methylobacter oryzae]|uniref:EAL domain-containing protein n=1 Tax=Candidatus Methylobacter oryzae TaxID=2497749 RepID=A0ABY3CDY0_9GAMM|nr:bifunctional diguanylate cyclase/phosphodiesterase [Candidatus Methylobacter oryzae]TRX00901.1 EAL domain-containing protein [Candidatus Methylobacter oryzae]